MSSNPPANPDPNSQPSGQPQNVSWREQRRMERQQRRAARRGSGGAWIGGAILILLGVIFLLQNMGALAFDNWWALFILIPAIASFGGAWRMFSEDGLFTGRVLGSFVAGLFFTGLALAFLFNLNLTWIGPIALIIFGVAVLVAGFMR